MYIQFDKNINFDILLFVFFILKYVVNQVFNCFVSVGRAIFFTFYATNDHDRSYTLMLRWQLSVIQLYTATPKFI